MAANDGNSGDTCAVKAGFFLLHKCGEPAVATCACCRHPVCLLHTTQVEEQTWCTECAANRPASTNADTKAGAGSARSQFVNNYNNDYDYMRSQSSAESLFWAFQFRNHYYHSVGMPYGPMSQRGFDANDAIAFTNPADMTQGFDDDPATDLFDS